MSPHRVIVRRVGLRGEALTLLGAAWILMGVGVLTGQHHPQGTDLWHLTIPETIRGWLWIISGLSALIGARCYRLSNIALFLLMLMPMARATSFLWAWIVSVIPGPPAGMPGGWFSAVYHLVMIGFVFFTAHIPATSWREDARQARQINRLREAQ